LQKYGVLYIVTGEKYINEAVNSAKSVKNNMDIEISIATDEKTVPNIFDNKINLNSMRMESACSTILPELTPYEKTIFLDSDTYICDDLWDMLTILDDYDLSITQSPGRLTPDSLSPPWIEYNTGVISYNDSSIVNTFFEKWNAIQSDMKKQKGMTRNQPSFVKTISGFPELNYFVLSREYNVRVPRWGGIKKDAKIIHGRPIKNLAATAETINKYSGYRIFYPSYNPFTNSLLKVKSESQFYYRILQFVEFINKRIKEFGIGYVLKKGLEWTRRWVTKRLN